MCGHPTMCWNSCTRDIKFFYLFGFFFFNFLGLFIYFKAAEWLSGNISSEKKFGKFRNFLAGRGLSIFLSFSIPAPAGSLFEAGWVDFRMHIQIEEGKERIPPIKKDYKSLSRVQILGLVSWLGIYPWGLGIYESKWGPLVSVNWAPDLSTRKQNWVKG